MGIVFSVYNCDLISSGELTCMQAVFWSSARAQFEFSSSEGSCYIRLTKWLQHLDTGDIVFLHGNVDHCLACIVELVNLTGYMCYLLV